jgi:hypothetical protein
VVEFGAGGVMRGMAKSWLPGLIVLLLLAFIYGGTLQRDVSGSDNDYVLDTGEIQVALNLWGTIHYTGYPLFTVTGSLLTHALRLVGLAPAAAASAVSAVWSLLGLAVVYRLILRLTDGERGLAAFTVLALGMVETFWMHSVVAEVYSFSLLLVGLTLLLATDLADRWNGRRWWALMFFLGLGAQHHRLLLLLLPIVLLLVWPRLRERRGSWPVFLAQSAVVFIFPFLAYLYLPLRALQGARWVYGQPGTWTGFWAQFTGEEVTPYVLGWPRRLHTWLDNGGFLIEQLQHQMPLAVLLAGGIGLFWLTLGRRTPWMGLSLLAGVCAFSAFVLTFPEGVWAPAVLMPSLLLLMLGLAYLLCRLAKRVRVLRWGAWAGLSFLALWLFRSNLPFVYQLANDSHGREVIQTLRPLNDADLPGGGNVVALPWGRDYFAAAYGLYVTGELEGFALVDHRAPLQYLERREGKIITLASHLGYWPLEWWSGLFGEAHYASAAPGVAMVSQSVLYADVPLREGFDLDNGVRVRATEVVWQEEDRLQVSVYWEATRKISTNYRVAVHLVAKDPPENGWDILSQADALNPVDGWYPTELWSLGEVVRDDYALAVPRGSTPVAVRIAMYQIGTDGAFVNTEWLSLPIPE